LKDEIRVTTAAQSTANRIDVQCLHRSCAMRSPTQSARCQVEEIWSETLREERKRRGCPKPATDQYFQRPAACRFIRGPAMLKRRQQRQQQHGSSEGWRIAQFIKRGPIGASAANAEIFGVRKRFQRTGSGRPSPDSPQTWLTMAVLLASLSEEFGGGGGGRTDAIGSPWSSPFWQFAPCCNPFEQVEQDGRRLKPTRAQAERQINKEEDGEEEGEEEEEEDDDDDGIDNGGAKDRKSCLLPG
jgi:hypothetical protein